MKLLMIKTAVVLNNFFTIKNRDITNKFTKNYSFFKYRRSFLFDIYRKLFHESKFFDENLKIEVSEANSPDCSEFFHYEGYSLFSLHLQQKSYGLVDYKIPRDLIINAYSLENNLMILYKEGVYYHEKIAKINEQLESLNSFEKYAVSEIENGKLCGSVDRSFKTRLSVIKEKINFFHKNKEDFIKKIDELKSKVEETELLYFDIVDSMHKMVIERDLDNKIEELRFSPVKEKQNPINLIEIKEDFIKKSDQYKAKEKTKQCFSC